MYMYINTTLIKAGTGSMKNWARTQSLGQQHPFLPQRSSSSASADGRYSEGRGFESQLDPAFSVDPRDLTQCLNAYRHC